MRRNKWLSLLKQHEVVTTTTDSTLYNWLKKNDEKWLLQHSNFKKPNGKTFNWEKKDRETLEEVRNIVKNWAKTEVGSYPRRITKHSIAKQSSAGNAITKNGKQMKETLGYISTVSETPEQFHLRKLEWAYKELRKNRMEITKTNLRVKAGLDTTRTNGLMDRYF